MEVKLIAYTPNPDKVCAIAAKNCVSKEIPEDVEDLNSLTHAMRAGHTSVAENASFTFSIEGVSRVLETQLVRHRIGASFAIQSGRYVAKGPTDMVIPQSVEDALKRDLAYGEGELNELIEKYEEAVNELAIHLESAGAEKQDIRYFYPQGAKTNIVMTMNGRELLHWLSLRLCTRAQKEHRELAEKILKLVKEVSPTIFENAGPSCVRDGFCRESKSCGRAPKLENVMEIMYEMDGEASIRDEQRTAERECHR